MESQYSSPVVIQPDGTTYLLERLPLSASGGESEYDEEWLQNLLYENPDCLPIAEIDGAYTGIVPICQELPTPAGPADLVYATPKGKLVLLEAKLWRNPEARRKVVAQILDYAKEFARWSYEDLQREVSRVTKRKGNALYELVAERYPETDEATFVDEVSKSLRAGRFMLLIVGDGIREGAGAIAEFLQGSAALHFTMGLVEMVIYRKPGGELLVHPRIIARTEILERSVIILTDPNMTLSEELAGQDEELVDQELSERERFFTDFWTEFLDHIQLDDVSQPVGNPTTRSNIFFMFPAKHGSWVTVYFSKADKAVGVFLGFNRGAFAEFVCAQLFARKDEISRELGVHAEWRHEDGKCKIISSKKFPDLHAAEHREEIKSFLADRVNRYVNVFRPVIIRLDHEFRS